MALYDIHTVRSDNDVQFTGLPNNREGLTDNRQ